MECGGAVPITISGVVWLYLTGSGQQVQLDVGVRQSVGVHWLQALAAQTEVRISAASDLRFPPKVLVSPPI